MPKRTDIESILIIGSGPIVIGQACEFDYSGTQACRVLKEEGYRVILANSNPATIMTDPSFADATYVEPLDLQILEKIIEKERPDAVLPTLGGQTGLNLAMELQQAGVLERFGCELIGADAEAIETAEDREKFKVAMTEIGLESARSAIAHTMDEAQAAIDEVGLPVIILDPMGVHTGDSITVAPAQTLTDVEYQKMRDGSFACIRRVGVETGGSNVQWAVDPKTGRQIVIEMNPRVSRSSALASKATGFPIAKIAAKLAIGYTLDEIPNDITEKTPASFEPSIDYVVTKIPRWAFEKFPGTSGVLGTSMQSVGEVMAIGRTFPESMQKALRSLEQGRHGLNADPGETALDDISTEELMKMAAIGTPDRPFQLEALLRRGVSVDEIFAATAVDPWFLDQMSMITEERAHLETLSLDSITRRGFKREGIEFDYCCVHASFSLRDAGYETIMVNCNPETVSTDYDTSDRLYFEPLTYEDVMDIIDREQPKGVIVSLGGQTPLKLADRLPEALVLGTSPASIDLAEDREQWNAMCARLEIPQPAGGTAVDIDQALEITAKIGYPALVRPSYVLGGRAMEIVYDDDHLRRAMAELAGFGSLGKEGGLSAERPVLVDRFLEDATEVDVDALRDHTGDSVIGAVMEHVEEAGVHSGDSACSIPPTSLSAETIAVIEDYTLRIAEALDVKGLINVQYAVKGNQVFVIEANPRASRTVPFVAKATGVPLAKVASRIMVGATLAELRAEGLMCDRVEGDHVAIKEAVLPFNRFPEADAVLGPEMRSTGEVMGIDLTPGLAFVKSQLAAGTRLPEDGMVFLSLADRDKASGVEAARLLAEMGFTICATSGTAASVREAGVEVAVEVAKLGDVDGVNAVDLINAGDVKLVVNSPRGRGPRADGDHIRSAAGRASVPLLTTGAAALAAAKGMQDWKAHKLAVRSLQEYHRGVSLSALEPSDGGASN
ncbi:MAG: carbamoyl-phosphate synthase large subunit [Acidimicrobiia bacterium]|nr:carbamoyl-phosphate synthase large subunit [Acidimicrobiia bacterium]